MTTPLPTCQHCGKLESEHDSQRDNHIFTVAAGFEQPVPTQPSNDTSPTPRANHIATAGMSTCHTEAQKLGIWYRNYQLIERELTALATELAATKDKFYASETMRHKALADHDSLRTQLDTQARQLAAVREALLKYGIHAQECALQVYGETVCSCGLEAALTPDCSNGWVKRELLDELFESASVITSDQLHQSPEVQRFMAALKAAETALAGGREG